MTGTQDSLHHDGPDALDALASNAGDMMLATMMQSWFQRPSQA